MSDDLKTHLDWRAWGDRRGWDLGGSDCEHVASFYIPGQERFVEITSALRADLDRYDQTRDQTIEYLRSLRPVWDEGIDARLTSAALAALWSALGVTNQTAAMILVRKLMEKRP